ncbi:MAG: helix-turn-helix domain-containing protein [Clostridiales bacterium]|jgi:AraC-like DNA-binding protein|nr:helix-turn-helix domain-containing protein [Clostridiales bacterium]
MTDTKEIVGWVRNENEIHIQFKPQNTDYDLGLINFGRHATPPKYIYGPLVRDFAVVHIITRGRGCVIIDDVRYVLQPDQCFAFFPGQIHYYESDAHIPWEYYYIGFNGWKTTDVLHRAGFSENVIARSLNCTEQVVSAISDLCETSNDPFQPFLQHGYMYQALHYLIHDAETSAGSLPVERVADGKEKINYARVAAGILNHSYAESITLNSLACNLGISEGYLNVCFQQENGKTVYQYLLERRINVAKESLRVTNKSIKRVALEVGYFDALYFARLFRRHVGCTPSQYRQLSAGAADRERSDIHGK